LRESEPDKSRTSAPIMDLADLDGTRADVDTNQILTFAHRCVVPRFSGPTEMASSHSRQTNSKKWADTVLTPAAQTA